MDDLRYRVTKQAGTEPPFSNEFFNHFKKGLYVDIDSGQPLFISSDKFHSDCGWPAFSKPIDEELILRLSDSTHGMQRTEVRSAGSGNHLGHVFKDGRSPNGVRFCINSASLRFVRFEDLDENNLGHLKSLFD